MELTLRDDQMSRICELDIQYERLAPLRNRNAAALDFLLFATCVYALDRSLVRETMDDCWTRAYSLTLPVSDPSRWKQSRSSFVNCLEFLTGDRWNLSFVAQLNNILRSRPKKRRWGTFVRLQAGKICLFSGGLDSLAGTIDLLERSDDRILLIGHHDRDMAGPYSDQQALLQRLRSEYPGRISDVLVRVGQLQGGGDVTLRGRSLLFIALGVFAASSFGAAVPVVVPENGTIALNVPLTPSRRGSCSTRTAHPEYLRTLGGGMRLVGLENPVVNPFDSRTKGEILADCCNPQLLSELAVLSVSCAKRGHRREWLRRDARSCGRCMPCIYRRAALHKVDLDHEPYGLDVCLGEVDVDGNDEGGGDLRACLSFLARNLSKRQIATALLVNGKLDVRRLTAYADTVARAMDEVRQLFRDKGSKPVRRAAGIRV